MRSGVGSGGRRIRTRIHLGDAEAAALTAIGTLLEQRYALAPGQLAPVDSTGIEVRSRRRWRGYRSAAERFAKTRRLAVLRTRVQAGEETLASGSPSITVGSKRL